MLARLAGLAMAVLLVRQCSMRARLASVPIHHTCYPNTLFIACVRMCITAIRVCDEQ